MVFIAIAVKLDIILSYFNIKVHWEKFVKSSRLVITSLVVSLLTSTSNLSANAQSSNNWVEQALGSYQSQILNAGILASGKTEFRKNSNGSLVGIYTMNEEGGIVQGKLSKCRAIKIQVMRCIWNDKYGTGELEVTFSEDFSSFNGYWGVEISEPIYRWSGAR
jgi:hypothetical protein